MGISSYDKVKKDKVKHAIGAIVLVISISIVFVWGFYGKEILTYRSVPVLTSGVQKGNEIKAEDLKMVKVSEKTLYKETVYDPNEIIGEEALLDIPKDMPLLSNYFIDIKNDLKKGKFVFSVPTDWTYSLPQTIRRGDEVSFYSVPSKENDGEETGLIIPQAINNSPIITAKVAYAKDSSNHEVVDLKGKGKRVDGSSNIATVEVLIDRNQYKQLLKEVNTGNQFIIMYQ